MALVLLLKYGMFVLWNVVYDRVLSCLSTATVIPTGRLCRCRRRWCRVLLHTATDNLQLLPMNYLISFVWGSLNKWSDLIADGKISRNFQWMRMCAISFIRNSKRKIQGDISPAVEMSRLDESVRIDFHQSHHCRRRNDLVQKYFCRFETHSKFF